jgi:hypothetical protein
MLHFERKGERLAPLSRFAWRVIVSVGITACLVLVALSVGVSGYHWIAGFDWVDAILEASMILAGMGPVNPLRSSSSKLFAAGYALFSGLIFIAVTGILLAPALHRLMHAFHIDEKDINK